MPKDKVCVWCDWAPGTLNEKKQAHKVKDRWFRCAEFDREDAGWKPEKENE